MSNLHKPIRIGIIGAGAIVSDIHIPVLRSLSNVSIPWVVDSNEERALSVAKKYKIKEALQNIDKAPEVDIVLLAIPIGARSEILEQCYQRKWNVFFEKPFARDVIEHDKIVSGAFTSGVRIGIGFMRRCYATTILARKIIQEQLLGVPAEIFAAEGARMRGTGRDSGWYQNDIALSGGGVLIETGSHLIDQVAWIFGAKEGELRNIEHESIDGFDYDVRINAQLMTLNIPARFALSRTRDLQNGIWIQFQKSTLFMNIAPDTCLFVLNENGTVVSKLISDDGAQNTFSAFSTEWSEFINFVVSGEQSKTDVSSARLSSHLIGNAYLQMNRNQKATSVFDFNIAHGAA